MPQINEYSWSFGFYNFFLFLFLWMVFFNFMLMNFSINKSNLKNLKFYKILL